MLKFKNRITICILFVVSFFLSVGFQNADKIEYTITYQNADKMEYTITYQNTEETIACYYNEEGILLLPLQDMTSLLGLEFLDCGRCGKDEIYNKNFENPKGHIFVNWYQNVITYSNDPTVILLDADNEKIDGMTYTSSMLFQYLGAAITVDDKEKTITISNADNIDFRNEIENEANGMEELDKRIVYAYDPSCSSCDKITALLEKFEEEGRAVVIKLDASLEDMHSHIKVYEEECKVPEELKGIYPILYMRGEYLFHSEITEDNINSFLSGKSVVHSIVSGIATEVDNVSEAIVQEGKVMIYFYSTTCASCKSAVDLIQMMKSKYPDLELVGYNLYIPDNITLLKAYGKKYGLDKKENGEIPAVFFSDHSLIGEEEIGKELELIIIEYDKDNPTKVIDAKTVIMEKNILNGLSVFGAGLLNGINPCSLSMFLFLLSLVMVDLKKVLKIGISFCFGKFLMFFLLGTAFYQFIAKVDVRLVDMITKNLLILMIITFAVLNIYDYSMAKRENYHKMILQLPSWLKGSNQRIMKGSTKYTRSGYVIVLMVLIGMLLGFGEFLCTGQIYLASIIVLIQGTSIEGLAVFYLILYSIAFVLPLLVLTLFVYYGKKVFRLSETLLEKLPFIKIINSILFILYGLYVIFR